MKHWGYPYVIKTNSGANFGNFRGELEVSQDVKLKIFGQFKNLKDFAVKK